MHFIKPDHEDGGFYLISSKVFDNNIKIEHTCKKGFVILLPKKVKPDSFKILDFHIDLADRSEGLNYIN
jgi:hypothetical protein